MVKKPLVEVQKLLVRFDTGIQGTNVQDYYEIDWVLRTFSSERDGGIFQHIPEHSAAV